MGYWFCINAYIRSLYEIRLPISDQSHCPYFNVSSLHTCCSQHLPQVAPVRRKPTAWRGRCGEVAGSRGRRSLQIVSNGVHRSPLNSHPACSLLQSPAFRLPFSFSPQLSSRKYDYTRNTISWSPQFFSLTKLPCTGNRYFPSSAVTVPRRTYSWWTTYCKHRCCVCGNETDCIAANSSRGFQTTTGSTVLHKQQISPLIEYCCKPNVIVLSIQPHLYFVSI